MVVEIRLFSNVNIHLKVMFSVIFNKGAKTTQEKKDVFSTNDVGKTGF
jgi:hypothetical protein